MRITEVKIEYAEPTFPGGMTVAEMQTVLTQLEWSDGGQVAEAAMRCSNRCNGSPTTTVDVKASVV